MSTTPGSLPRSLPAPLLGEPPRTAFSSLPSHKPTPRRLGLPSEALEEFLSILRPSMFPPNSPRRRTANTVPPWNIERSTVNLKSWARIEGPPPKTDIDDRDLPRFANDGLSPAPVGTIPEKEGMIDGDTPLDADAAPFRWFSSGVLCELSLLPITMHADLAT
jgi:hypothetical protein